MLNTVKRMLTILTVALLGIGSGVPCIWGETLRPDSRVAAVTVYPAMARVTRRVTVSLTTGEHRIVFAEVVPQLDENSITVSGQGTADVQIFGATSKREYRQQAVDARVRELEQQIEHIDDQIFSLNQESQNVNLQREFLASIKLFAAQQIPQDLATSMPTPEELTGIQQYLADGLQEQADQTQQIRMTLRDRNKARETLVRELNEIRQPQQKMQRSIVVDLACRQPGELTLDVSYLVKGATWKPVYDARAHFEDKSVELTLFGEVRQTTGEDWKNVDLTLSTVRPSVGGRMPYVSPWTLQERFAKRQRDYRGVRMQEASADKFSEGVAAGATMPASTPEDKGNAEIALAEVAQQGIAVTYHIPQSADIVADGAQYKFPVTSQTLNSDFFYSAYPRALPMAYLGTRVKNTEDFNLLSGPVNLFLDKDYVGTSSVDTVGPGENFDLYLGADENVKVKREQVSKKVDDVLLAGIRSSTIRTTYTYKLAVENYKSFPIRVRLFEAMPVSQNERIKVKVHEVSQNPAEKDWRDRQGVWLWTLDLQPQDTQTITYTFSIEHPRDMAVADLP